MEEEPLRNVKSLNAEREEGDPLFRGWPGWAFAIATFVVIAVAVYKGC